MSIDQKIITEKVFEELTKVIRLVEASTSEIAPFDPKKIYTPKEQEPYDALCDRFIRAVEISIKFFRSYEKLLYGENSETLRDLLNKMEKLEIVSSVMLWMKMRDVRNRIVHSYSPEALEEIYGVLIGTFSTELIDVLHKDFVLSVLRKNIATPHVKIKKHFDLMGEHDER